MSSLHSQLMERNYPSCGLTHWGHVTHICVSEIIIIDSDNGLSPGRRQAIIWANAEILLIGLLGINFSEILIEINTFSFNKMHLKMSSWDTWQIWPWFEGSNIYFSKIQISEISFSNPHPMCQHRYPECLLIFIVLHQFHTKIKHLQQIT